MGSPDTRPIRLSEMKVGQSGDLTKSDDESTPVRLQELGFVAGTRITMLRSGPMGDPVELELRGYRICLRRSDLSGVRVQILQAGTR